MVRKTPGNQAQGKRKEEVDDMGADKQAACGKRRRPSGSQHASRRSRQRWGAEGRPRPVRSQGRLGPQKTPPHALSRGTCRTSRAFLDTPHTHRYNLHVFLEVKQ